MTSSDIDVTIADDRPVVVFRRTFCAPAHDVFAALTTPRLIEQWYGPRRYAIEVPELDLRPGGRWRFLNIDADGTVYAFHGEYIEIVPDERIVQTWVYEGAPDQTVMETAVLTERDGETTMTATAEYPSFQAREADLRQGMTDGAAESYDRLEEVLGAMAGLSGC